MYQCGKMEGGGVRNAGEIGEGGLQAEEGSASPSQTWGWWVGYRGLSAEGPAEVRTYRMWQVCVADREATQAGPAPGGLVPPKELSFTLGVLEG